MSIASKISDNMGGAIPYDRYQVPPAVAVSEQRILLRVPPANHQPLSLQTQKQSSTT